MSDTAIAQSDWRGECGNGRMAGRRRFAELSRQAWPVGGGSGENAPVHRANDYYGHSAVLARYCSVPGGNPPRIHGYLQHGWNIGDGMAGDHEWVAGVPLFLWSERTRRRAWSLGRRRTYVVGAPLAYLLRLDPLVSGAPREGTIWYPFHGWEGQHVRGDHERLIDQIRATEPGPVTVCLYWQEFLTAAVRRHYENAGFRVICHGYRGDARQLGDAGFLQGQLAELRRHRRVASNRLSSAVWYGILAGCEPAVYGDPMTLENEDPTHGGQARIRREWAELHGEQVDNAVAYAAAVEELGADRLASPAELRQLFRWK